MNSLLSLLLCDLGHADTWTDTQGAPKQNASVANCCPRHKNTRNHIAMNSSHRVIYPFTEANDRPHGAAESTAAA